MEKIKVKCSSEDFELKIPHYARGAGVVRVGTGWSLGVCPVCQVETYLFSNFFYFLFYHWTVVWYLTFTAAIPCFFLPSFPPSDWLHLLQHVRVFSSTSAPPWECGMMWSTSALFGLLLYSQSSITLHSTQLVIPLLKSCSSRSSLMRIHLVVPVRDDVGLAIGHHFLVSCVVQC